MQKIYNLFVFVAIAFSIPCVTIHAQTQEKPENILNADIAEMEKSIKDLAADRAELKEMNSSLDKIKIKDIKVDLWRGKRYGEYYLVTHSGSLYPKKPFILILRKEKAINRKQLKADVVKNIGDSTFKNAEVMFAEEFFSSLLRKHPEKADCIKTEQTKTMKNFSENKLKAMACRLGKNADEYTYLP